MARTSLVQIRAAHSLSEAIYGTRITGGRDMALQGSSLGWTAKFQHLSGSSARSVELSDLSFRLTDINIALASDSLQRLCAPVARPLIGIRRFQRPTTQGGVTEEYPEVFFASSAGGVPAAVVPFSQPPIVRVQRLLLLAERALWEDKPIKSAAHLLKIFDAINSAFLRTDLTPQATLQWVKLMVSVQKIAVQVATKVCEANYDRDSMLEFVSSLRLDTIISLSPEVEKLNKFIAHLLAMQAMLLRFSQRLSPIFDTSASHTLVIDHIEALVVKRRLLVFSGEFAEALGDVTGKINTALDQYVEYAFTEGSVLAEAPALQIALVEKIAEEIDVEIALLKLHGRSSGIKEAHQRMIQTNMKLLGYLVDINSPHLVGVLEILFSRIMEYSVLYTPQSANLAEVACEFKGFVDDLAFIESDSFQKEGSKETFLYYYAGLCMFAGNLFMGIDNKDEARALFAKAADLYDRVSLNMHLKAIKRDAIVNLHCALNRLSKVSTGDDVWDPINRIIAIEDVYFYNTGAWLDYGEYLAKKGDYDAALWAFIMARDCYRKDQNKEGCAIALIYLGIVYQSVGNREKARQHLELAKSNLWGKERADLMREVAERLRDL